jgi:hypothetical protein
VNANRSWSWLALALALSTAPARGAAQTGVEQASEAQTQRAREAFQAGKSALEQGRVDEALDQFNRADDMVSSPNSKLMIGRCLSLLGRPAQAYAMFAELIREASGYADGRYEQAAQAAANEQLAVQSRIALLTVHVNDPSGEATLSVAGHGVPRPDWAQPIAVEPGAVDVVLLGSAGERDSERLTLQAGSTAKIELAFEAGTKPEPEAIPAPAPTGATVPAPALEATAQPASSEAADDDGLRTWAYVAGAAGAAGIATFAVFGAMSSSAYSELEDACPERTECSPSLEDTAARGRTYQTVANVSLGVGIAALSAGVALWVLGAPGEELGLAVSPTGVRVRGAL